MTKQPPINVQVVSWKSDNPSFVIEINGRKENWEWKDIEPALSQGEMAEVVQRINSLRRYKLSQVYDYLEKIATQAKSKTNIDFTRPKGFICTKCGYADSSVGASRCPSCDALYKEVALNGFKIFKAS